MLPKRSSCHRYWLLLIAVWAGAVSAAPVINITGGNEELRENVRHFLALQDEPCATPNWRLRSQLRGADAQIRQAGQALGYYRMEFTRELMRDDDCWSLDIQLHPGDPVRLAEVSIEIRGDGADDSVFQSLRREPGLRVGDRLNHGRYESLKSRFGALAAARGYFDGRFERSRVEVDTESNTARVDIVYDTGTRYRFGEIRIEHDILDERFLRRYLNIEPGDYYDSDELLDLKTLYTGSEYFSLVSVAPRLQQMEDGEVPVDVTLEARPRRGYSAGVGVATDTGPRLLFGYQDRYFNDRGHKLSADLNLSRVRSSLQAAYTIPMARPAQESVRIYTGFQQEDTSTLFSERYTLGTSYTRWHDNQWLTTYSINYEMEDFAVGDEEVQRSHLIIPAFSLSRTKSDGSAYPTEGWSLLGRVSGSPETLGSDFSFLQLYGRAKYIQAFAGGRFLLRTEAGTTQVGEFSRLPASVRFFAGGDASVRGYSYKSLGPMGQSRITGEDMVIGGRHLLVNSVEYDYRFMQNWALAAFYDQGNAFDGGEYNLKRGVGAGVRWLSPIGPLRIDIARALDDRRGWKLHLSMGPDL